MEALRATAEELQAKLKANADAIRSKREMLLLMRERFDNEASMVATGEARRQRHRSQLKSAAAHAALKASLLAEKNDLIAALQQQTRQVLFYAYLWLFFIRRATPLYAIMQLAIISRTRPAQMTGGTSPGLFQKLGFRGRQHQ